MSVRPGKKFGCGKLATTAMTRLDSGKLFQTDAAVAGKVRSPMVEHTVREATSTDVVEERSRRRALRMLSVQRHQTSASDNQPPISKLSHPSPRSK